MTMVNDTRLEESMTVQRLNIVDRSGKTRITLQAHGDATDPELAEMGGASIAFYDKYGRLVAGMAINDGFMEDGHWQPTRIYWDRIAEWNTGIIDPDTDFRVFEPWSEQMAAEKAVERVRQEKQAADTRRLQRETDEKLARIAESNARWIKAQSSEGANLMAKRSSLTNILYTLARASATGRAARKGPGALAKREVRRQVYRAEGKATRKMFKGFGL